MIAAQTLRKPVKLIPVKKMNGSTFYLDPNNKIVCISWSGVIDGNTAKTLLLLGAEAVESKGYTRLLLDRRRLVEFDTEARVWIKNDLLKSRARHLAARVERLAYLNSSDTKGSIFSNFISAGIKMVFPNLTMKKFDKPNIAVKWLLGMD